MGAVSGEDVRVRTLRAQDRGMSNSPAERPATLIFDGDCGFCTTAVRWLERTLPKVPATLPFQWADLPAFGLTEAEARSKVWFVSGGRRYGGAGAEIGRAHV